MDDFHKSCCQKVKKKESREKMKGEEMHASRDTIDILPERAYFLIFNTVKYRKAHQEMMSQC